MRGEIAFNQVQLKSLSHLFRTSVIWHGILSYAGKIRGTLTDPLLEGEVRVKDASISMNLPAGEFDQCTTLFIHTSEFC